MVGKGRIYILLRGHISPVDSCGQSNREETRDGKETLIWGECICRPDFVSKPGLAINPHNRWERKEMHGRKKTLMGGYMPLRFYISANDSSMQSIFLIGVTEGRKKRDA
jgi:hypothetical protein